MSYPKSGWAMKAGRDRGSIRGAKRYIVTPDLQMLDQALAKKANITGTFFQSGAEAKRWIALHFQIRIGHVRNLRRQVRYPLHVTRPDGLKEKIGSYVADFVYEEFTAVGPDEPSFLAVGPHQWLEIVEDVKPSGGHREDLYLWKRLHVEAEYGFHIHEFTGRVR